VAQLSQEGSWTTSSDVRREVGISQQLLNRHLRALEADDLVQLENQGPGLPLLARVSSAGLRALGLRGPRPVEPGQEDMPVQAGREAEPPSQSEVPVHHDHSAPKIMGAAQTAQKPALQVSRRAYEFLEQLYSVLAPFLNGLKRSDYYFLTAPAMHKRPVVGALFEALSPYLPGLRAVEFKEIVASLTGVRRSSKSAPATHTRQAPGPAAGGQGPPKLSPAEAALEDQLERAMNPEYNGLAWYQRTRLMSDEWDRARRRRMGLFRTSFSSFTPRWQRSDWNDFNLARRQADHHGADYAQWVAVQFDRLAPEGEREVMPSELHGERSVEAYLEYSRVDDGDRGGELGPPPYSAHSFSSQDPSHLQYAQRLIAETTALAERIMGGDPLGAARLLAQAVRSGALPMAALDLAPLQRQEVLDILQKEASQYQPVRSAASPQPKVII
jgi:hypothetical protein